MADTTLNRYQLQNAIEKVDGYCITGRDEQAFERAKQECLGHLRDQIAQIESLTFEQFKSPKKFGA